MGKRVVIASTDKTALMQAIFEPESTSFAGTSCTPSFSKILVDITFAKHFAAIVVLDNSERVGLSALSVDFYVDF